MSNNNYLSKVLWRDEDGTWFGTKKAALEYYPEGKVERIVVPHSSPERLAQFLNELINDHNS